MDSNGMTPLPNHMDFEAMLKPRGTRPSNQDLIDPRPTYASWVVVSFSSKWCGPCQKLDKKLLVKHTPGVKWYAVDVDENDTTLGYCGLKSIPSFVIIKDGVFKDRKSGAGSVEEILTWLHSNGVPFETN